MDNIKEIIKLMPPRDSYPRMLFSNNGKYWDEGILERISDGCYYRVDKNYEESFLDNDKYTVKSFSRCKPIKQLSIEQWTDKLKIINWCHHQKEVVLVVNTCDCGSEDVWNQCCFDEDRLVDYKWNKINPETNELMYAKNKVFCDKECL